MTLDEIRTLAETDPVAAAEELMLGLTRGDPATFKQGYTIGNALIATLDQIPLTKLQIAMVLDRVIPERYG